MSALTEMPVSFFSGETVSLDLSFSDYAASDNWTLVLYLAGKSVGSVAGTPNGSRFTVSLTAAFTTKLEPGNYVWRAVVTNGSEVHVAQSGMVLVHPNVAEATAGALLSFEERLLAAIEAVIEGRVTKDTEAYSIAGRAVTKIPLKELVELREVYRTRVMALRNPGKARPKMRVAFTRPEDE